MVMVCKQVYLGYEDDYGNKEYETVCEDDGTENPDNAGTDWRNDTDTSASDADAAGGLMPSDVLGTFIGKDNIDYDAWMKESMTPEAQAAIQKLIDSRAAPSAIGKLLNAFKKDGKYDWAKIATAGAGLYKMLAPASAPAGYNKAVPVVDATRAQLQYDDPNRAPGSGGRQYFTDTQYSKTGDPLASSAAKTATEGQAAGILGAYRPVAAPAVNPWAGKMKTSWNSAPATAADSTSAAGETAQAGLRSIPTAEQLRDPNFKIGMANGGLMAAHGRYLQGGTDGMADKIPSSIDGDQPAALSHGEFVIPADVVSHLGNGNSDAGAEKLYQMMARIRKARTGNSDQGKKINPDKFMPGGLANSSYATGGNVQHFDTGGIPLDVSTSKGLAPWAGDYVTNMLGEGAALAKAPMQVYGGPLTAGASNLQQQGFAGISDVAQAGYDPAKFTSGTFDTAAATKYMNPYLQASLNPQLAEARRQSEITQLGNAGRATQAGAFGGGRQAIMDAESQRSLGANLANITGTGYNTAYDKAQQQFNTEQGRSMDVQNAEEASRKYSADYGLKSLSDLMAAGATERGIAAEGIAADKKQFEEQAAHPFNMVEFQRKLVEGLPIGSSTVSTNPDDISKIKSDIAGLAAMYQTLSNLGIKSAT